MRCLTLADALRSQGMGCMFIMRDHEASFLALVRQRGYEVHLLPSVSNKEKSTESTYADWLGTTQQTDAEQTIVLLKQLPQTLDWLVIDHYALDRTWQAALRNYSEHLFVIDDLANRAQDCDLLLDQNLYHNMSTRYDGLLPESATELLGPEFALLRPEFKEARQHLRKRDGNIKRVFVFFGGADLVNMTTKTIEAISDTAFRHIQFDIVIGSANPERQALEQMTKKLPNVQLHTQVSRMSELLSTADFAIGAAGTTSWERCCLGVPSIVAVLADNQQDVADGLAYFDLGISLGNHAEITPQQICNTLLSCMNNPDDVREMSERCLQYVDGLGTERVVEQMMAMNHADHSLKRS